MRFWSSPCRPVPPRCAFYLIVPYFSRRAQKTPSEKYISLRSQGTRRSGPRRSPKRLFLTWGRLGPPGPPRGPRERPLRAFSAVSASFGRFVALPPASFPNPKPSFSTFWWTPLQRILPFSFGSRPKGSVSSARLCQALRARAGRSDGKTDGNVTVRAGRTSRKARRQIPSFERRHARNIIRKM